MNAQLSHAENQAHSLSPQPPTPPAAATKSGQKVMVILSVCMALQMTSYVMILPLFARRFSELGAGVQSLGVSAMAFALAATLAAPFMGTLADRYGRRPVVMLSLAAYVLAFTGYLFATSVPAFFVLRALAGAFTAGLVPAVNGIAADLAPADRRAQWLGIVSGGTATGWIAGPVLGGLLYDHWGYEVALIVAIGIAVATFSTAFLTVPETHKNHAEGTGRALQNERWMRIVDLKSSLSVFQGTLPGSLSSFLFLLCICFAVMFAWAFIEPGFMFYTYNDLGWSSSMLGLVMSTYGTALMLGEVGLGHLSDRLGRKSVIVLGSALFSAQFIGLAFFRNYVLIAATFVVGGLGNALYDPALSASILDIAPKEHQARALGLKSMAGSLGNILGPALVVLVAPFVKAQGIFLISVGIVLLSVLIGLAGNFEGHPSRAASRPAIPDGLSTRTSKTIEKEI